MLASITGLIDCVTVTAACTWTQIHVPIVQPALAQRSQCVSLIGAQQLHSVAAQTPDTRVRYYRHASDPANPVQS